MYNHFCTILLQGVPRIWEGGPRIFFRFGNLHVAKRYATYSEAMRKLRIARGFGVMLPEKFF